MTLSHAPYRELIAGGIDRPLDDRERALVAGHISGCPSCRALQLDLRADARMLAEPVLVTPPVRIRSEIERRLTIPDVDPRLLRTLRVAVTAAVLLAAVVVLAIAFALTQPRPTDPLETQAPAATSVHGLRST